MSIDGDGWADAPATTDGRRSNPKCTIAAAGGYPCDLGIGSDPSQRCGSCRGFVLPKNHGERQRSRKRRANE